MQRYIIHPFLPNSLCSMELLRHALIAHEVFTKPIGRIWLHAGPVGRFPPQQQCDFGSQADGCAWQEL